MVTFLFGEPYYSFTYVGNTHKAFKGKETQYLQFKSLNFQKHICTSVYVYINIYTYMQA